MRQIAETDTTFTRRAESWVGRCLICNGPVRFDARTGEGANIEHILPRSLGGTSDLRNLGVTHARCNSEKGIHWDPKARHRADPERYAALLARLQAERLRRWREPADAALGESTDEPVRASTQMAERISTRISTRKSEAARRR